MPVGRNDRAGSTLRCLLTLAPPGLTLPIVYGRLCLLLGLVSDEHAAVVKIPLSGAG